MSEKIILTLFLMIYIYAFEGGLALSVYLNESGESSRSIKPLKFRGGEPSGGYERKNE